MLRTLCRQCGGRGSYPPLTRQVCSECGGEGEIRTTLDVETAVFDVEFVFYASVGDVIDELTQWWCRNHNKNMENVDGTFVCPEGGVGGGCERIAVLGGGVEEPGVGESADVEDMALSAALQRAEEVREELVAVAADLIDAYDVIVAAALRAAETGGSGSGEEADEEGGESPG